MPRLTPGLADYCVFSVFLKDRRKALASTGVSDNLKAGQAACVAGCYTHPEHGLSDDFRRVIAAAPRIRVVHLENPGRVAALHPGHPAVIATLERSCVPR
jgi:hypothetical protein